MNWTDERITELRALWALPDMTIPKIARRMGMSRGQVDGKSRILGLQFHHSRRIKVVPPTHDAMVYAATAFPSTVKAPDRNVLKSAFNQRKIGGRVRKGAWKGFPIYALTLEERATCPRSCAQFASCYGNHMRWAVRYAHGLPLELQIWRELDALQERYPRGFVVRLHILGDFYSVGYVDMWRAALDHFPALRVFGYTAWQFHTPIGRAVADLRDENWPRFAVRTSGAHQGPRTSVIARREAKRPDSIVCPAQLGQTTNCSTCALCWATNKPISFLRH